MLLFVLVCLLACPAAPALAAAQVVEGGAIRLHYQRAPLKQIAEEIGRATGRTIIIDPDMRGSFTITIARAVSPAEALAVLDASLIMQGYALLQGDDGALKVLAVTDAATGSQWRGPLSLEEDRSTLVTTLLTLEDAKAEDVASQMQHLVSRQDTLLAFPPSNSLT